MATLIKLSALQNALRQTIPAASDDKNRPALQCVHFSSTDKSLRIESADGFRACIVTLPYGDDSLYATDKILEAMIYAGNIKDVLKIKDSRKEPVYVYLKYTPAGLSIYGKDYARLDSPLRYPDVNMVVPLANRAWFSGTLPADFSKGADIMSAFGKHTAATWTLWTASAFGHVLQTRDEEFGAARYDMTADVTCNKYPSKSYGINSKFLKAVCDAADKSPITFYLGAPNGPMRFDFDNTVYVIMPMHVDRDENVTPFDWQDTTPAAQPPAFNYSEYIKGNEYCHVKHDATPEQVENFYMRDDTFAPAIPLPDAVECEIEYIDAKLATPTYGKPYPYVAVKFAVTRTICQQAPSTKSERMTALNIERAKIMRQYKKDNCLRAYYLKSLYKAFGNAQRKTPVTYDPDKAYPAAKASETMRAIIYARRAAHDITPLVNGQVGAPCHAAMTCITG